MSTTVYPSPCLSVLCLHILPFLVSGLWSLVSQPPSPVSPPVQLASHVCGSASPTIYPRPQPHACAFLLSLPQFNPELVLVSAGFDAAWRDPLGGCQLSPEGYAHLTHLLMGLAGGRIILILEVTFSVPLSTVRDGLEDLGVLPFLLTGYNTGGDFLKSPLSAPMWNYWHILSINNNPSINNVH